MILPGFPVMSGRGPDGPAIDIISGSYSDGSNVFWGYDRQVAGRYSVGPNPPVIGSKAGEPIPGLILEEALTADTVSNGVMSMLTFSGATASQVVNGVAPYTRVKFGGIIYNLSNRVATGDAAGGRFIVAWEWTTPRPQFETNGTLQMLR